VEHKETARHALEQVFAAAAALLLLLLLLLLTPFRSKLTSSKPKFQFCEISWQTKASEQPRQMPRVQLLRLQRQRHKRRHRY
jgi:hypothetical protein